MELIDYYKRGLFIIINKLKFSGFDQLERKVIAMTSQQTVYIGVLAVKVFGFYVHYFLPINKIGTLLTCLRCILALSFDIINSF